MEKILMKGLENFNMTLNNHKRYRYGAEFYNFISFRNADLFYFGCQYQCLYIKSHFHYDTICTHCFDFLTV